MRFDVTTEELIRSNQANWDARTPVHVASAFYGLDGTRDTFDWFAPFEWDDLGDLHDLDVLHAQCHLGIETHAFVQQGARRTVGLDFSTESIAQARRIAANVGVEIEFVRADVYDAATVFEDRSFDVIYTGKGSLCYLPDLTRWARGLAGLLRPGGLLYVTEFHPLLESLGREVISGQSQELVLHDDYLAGRGVEKRDATYTYTDGPALDGVTVSYEWRHGLDEVINAMLAAGLNVRRLRESDLLPWQRWHSMVRADNGWWRLPEDAPRIPLIYAIRAVKDA